MRPPLKNIRHHGDFRIALAYEDGLVAELDFRKHLENRSGPMIEPLQNQDYFSQATIDHGVLTWPNGYDVCPDVLRLWAEAGRVLGAAETNARCAGRLEQSVG